VSRVHVHPVHVYYEDTDFSGVVYHANYLRYFERAREHLIGVHELVRLWKEDGAGFVVYKADLTFKEGAVHGDILEIRTTLTRESEWRLRFDHAAWRPGGTAPLVTCKLDLVTVDRQQKLIPLPPRVIEALDRWETDG
jgi:acyl-CoA thioester hydrolase